MASDSKGVEMVTVTITQNQVKQLEQLKELAESWDNTFTSYSRVINDLFYRYATVVQTHQGEQITFDANEICMIKDVVDLFNTILPHDTLTA